jgi:ABC-type multidrug transport system fused ATPase/permease subunit
LVFILEVDGYSLRKHIGVVLQDPTLFNDTIRRNIHYVDEDASDERVYATCRLVAIYDMIMSLPNG